MKNHILTDLEYQCLLDLYHNFNEAFQTLSEDIKQLYFNRLYSRIHGQ